jgi:hypothetical protein
MPGASCGIAGGATGSVGMICIRKSTGRPAILSAAHVIAADRGAGAAVLQPGPLDGGTPNGDRAGLLADWMLDSDGDAAVAELDPGAAWLPVPYGSQLAPQGVRHARLGETLITAGRSSGVARRLVDGIGRYRVPFRDAFGAEFTVDIDGFSLVSAPARGHDPVPGDSGALCAAPGTGEGVGLLFAVDGAGRALACHLPRVMERLGLRPASFGDLLALAVPVAQPAPARSARPITPDCLRDPRDALDFPDDPRDRPAPPSPHLLWRALKSALRSYRPDLPEPGLETPLHVWGGNGARAHVAEAMNRAPAFAVLGFDTVSAWQFGGAVTFGDLCEDLLSGHGAKGTARRWSDFA